MSGLLLIATLNARNPIPNAASILSHSPKTLVLIKHDSLNEFVEEGLKLSFQRLESWCESSLERLYGFDYEFDFGPEYPSIPPEIHIIDFESKIQTERAILSLVEKISEQEGGAPEIRCECNAGRKEDSAMMVDISRVLDGSCWYTDVDSGISVCIGDTGEESPANQLSPFSRFWLSGFPCIAGYEIPEVREKEILRVVLNCFCKSLNSGKILKKPELAMKRVGDTLGGEGIEIIPDSESGRFRFVRVEDGVESDFWISESAFSSGSGDLVEELAALSLAESLGPESRIISGLRWTNETLWKRRQNMHTALLDHRSAWAIDARRSLFDYHLKERTLPSKFEEFDRKIRAEDHEPTDEEVLVRKWFEKWTLDEERWEDLGRFIENVELSNEERQIRKWFVLWALNKELWKNYPPHVRKEMEQVATRRELDIIVFDPSLGTIFIECKTSPDHRNKVAGKVQLGSLVSVLRSHRNMTKIGVHSATNREGRKESDGSITVGWSSLRNIRDLLSDA